MAEKEVFITTTDNPFDPFDDFDNWQAYDHEKGYYTIEYLMRVARFSLNSSEAEQKASIEEAIDEIVDLNITGNYKKLVRDAKDIKE